MLSTLLSTLLIALAASSTQVAAQNNVELATVPVQTFFIPFKEDDIFWNMFFKINSGRATAPVESTIALAFSTADTVIWYDHWEDGYELDVTNATQSTTEVWGDGKASNGCAPKVVPCTDATDIIRSGQSLVINNTVPIPRVQSTIFYDGGDRMQASFPITVTRGAYPTVPGSLMAGSTDIIETENWGMNFVAPTGENIGKTFPVFEYSGLFFMASHDNTTVTLPNKTKIVLHQGGSASVMVNQGDKLTSDNIIQVHLITGDLMSFYEMRWYSLLPSEAWSNSYLSPVGDTFGKTKMFLYNPFTSPMILDVKLFNTTHIVRLTGGKTGSSGWTDVITTGSGALVTSRDKRNFLALSLTDTENRTSTGVYTLSEWYDWGFTVLPTNILTSQVLIGWGYACTNNNCYGQQDRSVIWVTPMADADIYIDHKNSGVNRTMFTRKALTSSKFVDIDQDMSGALIFATEPGSGIGGKTVDIAAAWGQDPSVSFDMQSISLDLGTVVRPFPNVRASKSVDKPLAAPGETLVYTIKLINMGQVDLPGGSVTVFDTLDSKVSYVPGTASIAYNVGANGVVASPLTDNSAGTPFPFDEAGYKVMVTLPKRGGSMDVTFNVTITGAIDATTVINQGEVRQPFGANIKFEATTELLFTPNITLDNKVYLGDDDGSLCGTEAAKEYVEELMGSEVVYCFNVTNNGNTFLTNLTLGDVALQYTNSKFTLLPPGNSTMVYFKSKINAPLLNMANVSGVPAFFTGSPIAGLSRVSASDPSEVGTLIPAASISIDNTVALGKDVAVCGTELAVEYVEDFAGSDAVYCFNVTNTGNTYLANITLGNKVLAFTDKTTLGMLAPNATKMIAVPRSIAKALINNATVVANPVFKSGKDIPGLADVTDSDPSAVGIKIVTANVKIENTVYLGHEAGKCNFAVEMVSGKNNQDVTFCFVVTNTGNATLDIISVTDPILGYTKSGIGRLAPGESIELSFPSKITGDVVNNATVLANPVFPDGKDITFLTDVTDTDPSEVKKTADGDPREFVKPDPAGNKTCMDNAYEDAFNISDALVCTSKEVYLENVTSIAPKECKVGDIINIDVDASIRFNSARFDLGWYVAVDGGDALDGSCVVNGLHEGALYNVVDKPGSKTIIGSVNWNADAKGGKDTCGDIVTTTQGAGNIDTPITVDLPVVCADENKDGTMDVAICFTWRNDANDDVCTMTRDDPLTKGRLADMFPGAVQGCYCERYEVKNIKVTTPPVLPC